MQTSSHGPSANIGAQDGSLRPENAENIYWLALRMTPGLGTRKAIQLLEVFRSPKTIFEASKDQLMAAGLPASTAQTITSGCAFEDAAGQAEKVARSGASLVAWGHPLYPAQLREIYDAPPLLFARGRIDLLQSVCIGVVGTRRPSPYGTAAAARLSKDLAAAGMTIVSGMARGIDTAAHRATLDDGGNTIAVFGCGVDQIYPAENRKLADEIASAGLLISEFPMGTPAYPQNFPIRNRVVSGLSVGVLVVEGSQYSGSAITAKLAIEQNREVFAVPGNITSRASWGPNLLIKQGAKLVQEWNDVVVELKPPIRRRLAEDCRNRLKLQDIGNLENPDATSRESGTSHQSGSESATANPLNRKLLGFLKPDDPVLLDALVDRFSEHSPSEIMASLFELELSGLIRQLPGRSYMTVWPD